MKQKAVLFDLDGTLADTGPDLVATLNIMRSERDLPAIDFETAKYVVGYGSRKLMQEYLINEGEDLEVLRQIFLAKYDYINHQDAVLFPGIQELINSLDAKKIPWAIVTNKPSKPTKSLLSKLGLDKNIAALVCSDTLPKYKPDPDGILHVCENLNIQASEGVYVGDTTIDENAANACNMPFLAAGWGYWKPELTTKYLLKQPNEILQFFD